jgi:hypothetical protein
MSNFQIKKYNNDIMTCKKNIYDNLSKYLETNEI